jgi:hypothetical protein
VKKNKNTLDPVLVNQIKILMGACLEDCGCFGAIIFLASKAKIT